MMRVIRAIGRLLSNVMSAGRPRDLGSDLDRERFRVQSQVQEMRNDGL
jgi:hypothetical protein